MKKRKKALPVLSVAVLCLLVAGNGVIGHMVGKVRNISVSTPDLSKVQDGDYIGEYSIAPVHVKAGVSVSNHRITGIALLRHDHGLGGAAERIVKDIVAEQSLDIDTVSGATVSSKCILKAVENAMKEEDSGR